MLHLTASSVPLAFTLARQHYEVQRFAEAEDICRQIVEFDSQNSPALHLLGVLARHGGRGAEAVEILERVAAMEPRSAEVAYDLAHALQGVGCFEAAIEGYERAIGLRDEFPEAADGLGNALLNAGRAEESVAAFRRAIALRPQFAQAWNNLGNALLEKGDGAGAIDAYRQATVLNPSLYQGHLGLGAALLSQGKVLDATKTLRHAIALRPELPEAYNNLASALTESGELEAAAAAARSALEIRPAFAEALSNLGNVLRKQDKVDEAVEAYRGALAIRADYPEALSNLGGALIDRSEFDEAISCFRRALELKPDFAAAHNLLFCLQFLPNDDPELIYREHAKWNERFAVPLRGKLPPPENDRSPERRLRVGYVAPDFRNHCQSFFTVPLLSAHDHERFEIFCYADVACPDAVTERLRGYADVWRETMGMSDAALADLIRADRIDILVDLTMHMAKGRPGVFARKAAPVQVTWLAYPGTTGLTAIDYRLTDPYLDPVEPVGARDAFYAEESVRLPETFWCYDPLTEEPAVGPLPALMNGFVTFGCLNNFAKVNDRGIALWRAVLEAVPTSRIIVLAPLGKFREHLIEKLGVEAGGVGRIEFVERRPRVEYLKLYHRIDLCLDTFPYNGHTTSLDALWMGVPVVSLCGRTAVARAGFSQMSNLGMLEFVGGTAEEYVKIAREWASDLERLSAFRKILREKMLRSPLMQNGRFATNMEEAFRVMWRRWCKNEDGHPFGWPST